MRRSLFASLGLFFVAIPVSVLGQFILADIQGDLRVTSPIFPVCDDCYTKEEVKARLASRMSQNPLWRTEVKDGTCADNLDCIYGGALFEDGLGYLKCQVHYYTGDHFGMTLEESSVKLLAAPNRILSPSFSEDDVKRAVVEFFTRINVDWADVVVSDSSGVNVYRYTPNEELGFHAGVKVAVVEVESGDWNGHAVYSVYTEVYTGLGVSPCAIPMENGGGFSLEKIDTYNIEHMVMAFLADVRAHGIEFSWPEEIDVEFVELTGGELGLAYGMDDDDRVVLRISPSAWSAATVPTRWYLIYHELGHDFFNLRHGEAGRMMFNYANREYSWHEFREDKEAMFIHAKRKYDAGTLWE